MDYLGLPELGGSKPTFVMSAITRLEDELLQPGWRAFEWGAGGSTIWLSQRCKSAVSIEHDWKWIEAVCQDLEKYHIDNVVLAHVELGTEYEDAIRHHWQGAPFDLIFVDGRRRAACIAYAVPHLRPGGILVLDDSQRGEYQSAIAGHLDGWQRWDHEIDFGGYEGWTTTIWRKPA